MASIILKFDKTNRQTDHEVIAEDEHGKDHIGYIVIEKPWYEPESNWIYWLYENDSVPNGFCGGATRFLKRTKIKKDSIRPATQINLIKHYLKEGLDIILTDDVLYGDTIATIKHESAIPLTLYDTE